MKTLITITAHAYASNNGGILAPEQNFIYVRTSRPKPTFAGAARMVANSLGCKPSAVSVARIEAQCYDDGN